MKKTKKVLIISTNAIGDAYLSMSAIKLLVKEYGSIEFTFVFPRSSEVLQFDDKHDYKILYSGKTIFSFVSILAKLIFKKFDFTFSFFPGRFNTFLLKLSNSRNKAGYYNYKKVDRWDDKSWIPIIKEEDSIMIGVGWNDTKNYLELISNTLEPFVSKNTIEKYKPVIIEKSVFTVDKIIINGKSRTFNRSLTISQFNMLIDYLNNLGYKEIFILGSLDNNNSIKDYLDYKEVTYLSDLNLEELIQKLNKAFFIGVDSFPLHIADAYNTNFIGLFTNTKPEAVLVNSHQSLKFVQESFAEISGEEFKAALEKIRIN